LVSGSSGCRLELAPSFEVSLRTFEKENYGKHEEKGRQEARIVIQRQLEILMDWPAVPGTRDEGFPPKCAAAPLAAGWMLQKVEFTAPRASGAARQGRLIYMIHKNDRIVVPLCVYTHKQYAKRVPDKPLEQMIADGQATAEQRKKEQAQAALTPTPALAASPSSAAGAAPLAMSAAPADPDKSSK
jgi:hypothetical protein